MRNSYILNRADFDTLFIALHTRGYTIIGPTINSGAIVYEELQSADDLPAGWTDQQDAGTYSLKKRQDNALFGYNTGPHSFKQFLFPPKQRVWSARRLADGAVIEPEPAGTEKLALLGARACDIAAIATQDVVFLKSAYTERIYQAKRSELCVIAVNCGQAGGTCFCVSTNTGPEVTHGYDLCLTELIDTTQHQFYITSGSELGEQLLADLPAHPAAARHAKIAEEIAAHTAESMQRKINPAAAAGLSKQSEHPQWDDIAQRCLACSNCTMVCPTCFCVSFEDHTDLSGSQTERIRLWDSCFTTSHSHTAGGSVRVSGKSRYRQWLTHKFSTWQDQFGVSGCVGCGRCITWCPAKIDITAEIAAITGSASESIGISEEKV